MSSSSSPVLWSWFNNVSSLPDSSQYCATMATVSTSVPIKFVLSIHIISSLLAIPLLIILLNGVSKTHFFHYNTKCLLNLHIFLLIWHSIARICVHSCDIITYSLAIDPCDIIPSAIRCLFTRLTFTIPYLMMVYSSLFIAIERLIATSQLKRYEGNRTIGPILAICQALLCIGVCVFIYIRTIFHSVQYYCFVSSTSSAFYSVCPGISIVMSQISCLFIFKLVYVINKAKRKDQGVSLTVRYQVEQVISTLDVLSPIVIISCLFLTVYVSFQISVSIMKSTLDVYMYVILMEGINFTSEYALLLPIMIFFKSQRVKREKFIYMTAEISPTWTWYQNISQLENKILLCSTMSSIRSSFSLRTVLMVHSIFSILALPILFVAFLRICHGILLHFNSKLDMNGQTPYVNKLVKQPKKTSHSTKIWKRLFLHITDLITYIRPSDPCDILPGNIRCFISRFFFALSYVMMAYTTLVLSIERLIAFHNLSTYESDRKIGPILVFCQILFTGVTMSVIYYDYNFSAVLYYCFSATYTSRPLFLLVYPGLSILASQLSCLILFRYLYHINKTMRLHLAVSLRVRYQIKQSLRTLDVLHPLVYTSCIFLSLFVSIQIILLLMRTSMQMDIYIPFIEGINLTPEYTFFIPIMIYIRSVKVRNEGIENHDKLRNATSDVYFTTLFKTWR